MPVDEKRLYATSDASVWAEEFIKEFGPRKEDIDEGLMIGWFANAICTATDAVARQLRGAMRKALNELGVPGPDTPAPVANAVQILSEAGGFEPIRCSPSHPCDSPSDEHIAQFGECFVKSWERFIDLDKTWRENLVRVEKVPGEDGSK
jgi:hypothetical protein